MATSYNRSGAGGAPGEGPCSTKPKQSEVLKTRPLMAQPKRAALTGTASTHIAPIEAQPDTPAVNSECSGKSHSALVALARLLARQAAAELSKAPAIVSGDAAS